MRDLHDAAVLAAATGSCYGRPGPALPVLAARTGTETQKKKLNRAVRRQPPDKQHLNMGQSSAKVGNLISKSEI